MDISNIANTPIEMSLAGEKLKVSRLNLTELMANYQKEAKEDYIKDVQAIAKGITDKSERLEFLSMQMKKLPSGEELERLAGDKMDTVEGAVSMMLTILNKHQEVSKDKVFEYFQDEKNTEEINAIVSYATSQDAEKKIPKKKKSPKAQ
jgi:hypothetical protein